MNNIVCNTTEDKCKSDKYKCKKNVELTISISTFIINIDKIYINHKIYKYVTFSGTVMKP